MKLYPFGYKYSKLFVKYTRTGINDAFYGKDIPERV
jgi:hypothetical protein